MIALACASCRCLARAPPHRRRSTGKQHPSSAQVGRQGGGETHGQGSLALTVRGHGCGCGCGWSPVSHCWRRPWDEASTGSRGSSVAAAPHSLEQRICSNTAVDEQEPFRDRRGNATLWLCGNLLCKQTLTEPNSCSFMFW